MRLGGGMYIIYSDPRTLVGKADCLPEHEEISAGQ